LMDFLLLQYGQYQRFAYWWIFLCYSTDSTRDLQQKNMFFRQGVCCAPSLAVVWASLPSRTVEGSLVQMAVGWVLM
jgi:hypothetical protein